DAALMLGVFALTIAIQAVRVLAIWLSGKAVGVQLSPRPYYVMGPLLFLVMLVPFTINGLAVRESFFVSFLGNLHVGADAAFATARLIVQENKGLAAGWNAGMRAASGRYFLILNADAWAVGDAVAHLAAFADEHPEAAVVGPRLSNPDGSLQRSVRGFPTLWRLATEYFYLRKIAPRSSLLNGFYGGGFRYDRTGEVETLYGAALLVRREAADEVGLFDEDFF